jgi:hypothetical protein
MPHSVCAEAWGQHTAGANRLAARTASVVPSCKVDWGRTAASTEFFSTKPLLCWHPVSQSISQSVSQPNLIIVWAGLWGVAVGARAAPCGALAPVRVWASAPVMALLRVGRQQHGVECTAAARDRWCCQLLRGMLYRLPLSCHHHMQAPQLLRHQHT